MPLSFIFSQRREPASSFPGPCKIVFQMSFISLLDSSQGGGMNQIHKKRTPSWPMLSAALALALSASMAPQAQASSSTIIVDGTTCSLADAIVSANTETATGGCNAGVGDATLDLRTDVTLSAPLPPIESRVTIAGNNHTISGNNTVRVLVVNGDYGGDLTIEETTISGGSADSGGDERFA